MEYTEIHISISMETLHPLVSMTTGQTLLFPSKTPREIPKSTFHPYEVSISVLIIGDETKF